LADAVARIKGRAVVSYYAHESLPELYPVARWRRETFRMRKNQQATHVGVEAKYETEVLLCNF